VTQSLSTSEVLARIIDGSPIASFVINNEHKVIHWNTAIEALSGIKREKIIGTSQQWRAFYSQERPTMADLIVNGAASEEIEAYYSRECRQSYLIAGAYEAENFFPDFGRNGRWLHFTASPIKDSTGALIGAIETLEDITERKNAEVALNESEKSFRALFEGAYDAIWVNDLEGNIQTANEASAELTGYFIEELTGMNIRSFISDESLKLSEEIRTKLIKNLSFYIPYEQRLLRKDGSERICMVTTNLITGDGEVMGFQNIARDVTEEKRLEENLHYYLQEITRAQEEERKRIARELHDDTVQLLGSLSRQLDNFIRKKHRLSKDDIAFLKDVQEQLNRGTRDVHRFSQALRLSVLDDFGLVPALRSLTKSLQDYQGITTELKITGRERRFSSEVEVTLFRIVQEALNNVGRHAQASEAHLELEFTKGRVRAVINDNGRGFELSGRLDDLPRSGKLGLTGIQERARLLGGTLEVNSAPGKGTTLIVEAPI
jgi:PAS domain S-box-containing protein